MSHLYFRPCNTTDPEEDLEDAALFKALHDEFGDGLTILDQKAPIPQDGLFLGRGRRNEHNIPNVLSPRNLRYWEDVAFMESISRSFLVTDLEGAEAEVARLHAEGKDAFLKSTEEKLLVARVPRGQALHETLGDMVWSFVDKPDCLMVQEAVKMSYERRLLVMNGKVVTQSPIAFHLTPLSRFSVYDETGFNVEDLHYDTPHSREARYSPEGTYRMMAFAQDIADRSCFEHFCLDLAILGDNPAKDPIEIIEYNPMQPGAVGLFGCSPYKIAAAIREALSPELLQIVEARQNGEIKANTSTLNPDLDDEEGKMPFTAIFEEDEDWTDEDTAEPDP